MLFMQISRHSPESCPSHNEKVRKITLDLMAKTEHLMKKNGIKMIGGWAAMPQHLQVLIFDAPSMEAMLKVAMEPEMIAWMGYHTTELMPVMTLEESMKLHP